MPRPRQKYFRNRCCMRLKRARLQLRWRQRSIESSSNGFLSRSYFCGFAAPGGELCVVGSAFRAIGGSARAPNTLSSGSTIRFPSRIRDRAIPPTTLAEASLRGHTPASWAGLAHEIQGANSGARREHCTNRAVERVAKHDITGVVRVQVVVHDRGAVVGDFRKRGVIVQEHDVLSSGGA
jgi:hypothetical protein